MVGKDSRRDERENPRDVFAGIQVAELVKMVAGALGDNQEDEVEQTEGADNDRYKYEQLEQFRNSQKYAEQLLKRYETKARELQAKVTRTIEEEAKLQEAFSDIERMKHLKALCELQQAHCQLRIDENLE